MSDEEKKKLGRPKTGNARIFRAFRLPAEVLADIQKEAKELATSEANVIIAWHDALKRARKTGETFSSAPEVLREAVVKSAAAVGPTFGHTNRLAEERRGSEPIPK